jgi:hypothetical protein
MPMVEPSTITKPLCVKGFGGVLWLGLSWLS